MFRRTLLYAGLPHSSRWYDVAAPGETVGARALVYLRRRDGVGAGEFRKVIKQASSSPHSSAPGCSRSCARRRSCPGTRRLWDTPNVAHDNPHDQRFHASLILGFADTAARDGVLRPAT